LTYNANGGGLITNNSGGVITNAGDIFTGGIPCGIGTINNSGTINDTGTITTGCQT